MKRLILILLFPLFLQSQNVLIYEGNRLINGGNILVSGVPYSNTKYCDFGGTNEQQVAVDEK